MVLYRNHPSDVYSPEGHTRRITGDSPWGEGNGPSLTFEELYDRRDRPVDPDSGRDGSQPYTTTRLNTDIYDTVPVYTGTHHTNRVYTGTHHTDRVHTGTHHTDRFHIGTHHTDRVHTGTHHTDQGCIGTRPHYINRRPTT